MSPHTATTDVAVDPLIAEGWSPRSFDLRQEDGTTHHGAAYDIGLAGAQLSLQASALEPQAGALELQAHRMGGCARERRPLAESSFTESRGARLPVRHNA